MFSGFVCFFDVVGFGFGMTLCFVVGLASGHTSLWLTEFVVIAGVLC